ncbi:MAG: pantoate--beta-alanine ligase [Pedosphaera sp.]|nr:pantoate--beta-alanine ligase [Pedosphaera sp.]
MKIVEQIDAMQRVAQHAKKTDRQIGFVPTMGYLHAGHISLVNEARRRVGSTGLVVVSIYVNPTQFAPSEDLTKYPRNLVRDRRLCRNAGVDVIFLPSDAVMYPGRAEGLHSTWVLEDRLSQGMEGASRATHFRGVTTVVAKLFNCVLPDIAVFGAKDWQQAAVVKRMITDLNFPIELVVAPTHREADGLAMSSRNAYLSPAERRQATVLWRVLCEAQALVRQSVNGLPAASLKRTLAKRVAAEPDARLDYIEVFDGATLAPARRVQQGAHMALAVYLGKTRLIDNAAL